MVILICWVHKSSLSVGGCGADKSLVGRPGNPRPQNPHIWSASKRKRAQLCWKSWLLTFARTTSETLKDRDSQARLLLSTICSSQTLHFVNFLISYIQHVIQILYFSHVLHLLFILFICILRCIVYIIFVYFACFDSPHNLHILHNLSCICSWQVPQVASGLEDWRMI